MVLGIDAVTVRSVALGNFGFDSPIEIGAQHHRALGPVGQGQERQRWRLRLIGAAFGVLACDLAVQSTIVLRRPSPPGHSPLGIAWTALTALVMFALAAGQDRAGRQLDVP